jgi:hypothetical protein
VLAEAERFAEAVGTAQAAVDADPLRASAHAVLLALEGGCPQTTAPASG